MVINVRQLHITKKSDWVSNYELFNWVSVHVYVTCQTCREFVGYPLRPTLEYEIKLIKDGKSTNLVKVNYPRTQFLFTRASIVGCLQKGRPVERLKREY